MTWSWRSRTTGTVLRRAKTTAPGVSSSLVPRNGLWRQGHGGPAADRAARRTAGLSMPWSVTAVVRRASWRMMEVRRRSPPHRRCSTWESTTHGRRGLWRTAGVYRRSVLWPSRRAMMVTFARHDREHPEPTPPQSGCDGEDPQRLPPGPSGAHRHRTFDGPGDPDPPSADRLPRPGRPQEARRRYRPGQRLVDPRPAADDARVRRPRVGDPPV